VALAPLVVALGKRGLTGGASAVHMPEGHDEGLRAVKVVFPYGKVHQCSPRWGYNLLPF